MKQKQYAKTLNILLDIIKRLYQGEKISTTDIELDYEVSIRSAQRYIKYLQEAGFNLSKEGKKYYLSFIIDDTQKTIFETIEALLKNSGISNEIKPLIKKLKMINGENVFYSKLDIEKVDSLLFSTIEEAIKKRKILKIKYKMDDGIFDFEIKPLKITNFEGYWYINALDKNDEYKTFHIKSIQKLDVTNKTFKVKKDILKNLDKAVNIWFNPTKEPILVELFADDYATKYVERLPLSSTQKMIKKADNTSTIYLEITHMNEILRKLIMWIPHIVVIEPKWLKEEVDKRVRSYMERYMN